MPEPAAPVLGPLSGPATAHARSRPILIAGQSRIGGIAEHAHYQAQELARRGLDVVMLCHPDHLARPVGRGYRTIPALRHRPRRTRLGRLLGPFALAIDHYRLAFHVLRLRPRFVLWDSGAEYFAPLWAWPHLALRALGTINLANLHDPVRLRHFGPEWLHRLSLRLLYRVLDGGLVHGPVPAEAGLPARLFLREAPLGYFEDLAAAPADRAEALALRAAHAIPAEAPLVLSFGHVADRKNLDLLIAALGQVPDSHLLVAGSSNAASQRQVADYRTLAGQLGLAGRVHFADGFIPDAEIPAHFAAADIVALTYRGDFVSQSGVLQHAAAFGKPVLVSCGPGPLRQTLERFALGELVVADSTDAIAAGLARMIGDPQDRSAAFAAYSRTASWATNVDQLLALEAEVRAARS